MPSSRGSSQQRLNLRLLVCRLILYRWAAGEAPSLDAFLINCLLSSLECMLHEGKVSVVLHYPLLSIRNSRGALTLVDGKKEREESEEGRRGRERKRKEGGRKEEGRKREGGAGRRVGEWEEGRRNE